MGPSLTGKTTSTRRLLGCFQGSRSSGDEHVQGLALLDVFDSLLVRYEREIVTVDLQDLVMNRQLRAGSRAVRFYIRHINTLKRKK